MSLTSLALSLAAPLPRIEQYERYLFLGPHPDDIEIGAGATAAKLAAAGKQVTFLICMDGRYGLEHAPAGTTPEQLVELRKAEAIASAPSLEDTALLCGSFPFDQLREALEAEDQLYSENLENLRPQRRGGGRTQARAVP